MIYFKIGSDFLIFTVGSGGCGKLFFLSEKIYSSVFCGNFIKVLMDCRVRSGCS